MKHGEMIDQKTQSELELQALAQIRDAGFPEPEQQYEGIENRRYRFDFAWPQDLIAVEIHGGAWMGKGHTGGKGFSEDRRKMNLANLSGWMVFEFTADMLNADELVPTLKEAFEMMEFLDGEG